MEPTGQIEGWDHPWEDLYKISGSDGVATDLKRRKVPGGWLVLHRTERGSSATYAESMCFVPDVKLPAPLPASESMESQDDD